MNRNPVAVSAEGAVSEKPALQLTVKSDSGAPLAVSEDGSASTERIREAAYRLYEARGHQDGHDLEDWLAAEASLSAKSVPDPSTPPPDPAHAEASGVARQAACCSTG